MLVFDSEDGVEDEEEYLGVQVDSCAVGNYHMMGGKVSDCVQNCSCCLPYYSSASSLQLSGLQLFSLGLPYQLWGQTLPLYSLK